MRKRDLLGWLYIALAYGAIIGFGVFAYVAGSQ